MKRQNTTKTILLVSLAVVLLVGATWAYLTATTDTKVNPFTFSDEKLTAEIDEPNWDEKKAENLVPGKDVPKDPLVINTCSIDEYVALKLTFTLSDGVTPLTPEQMAELMDMISIQGVSTALGFSIDAGWVRTDTSGYASATGNTQIFHWASSLTAPTILLGTDDAPLNKTTPLFNKVVFPSDITEAQMNWLNGKADSDIGDAAPLTGGGFKIVITGAAVQASAFTAAEISAGDVKTALEGLLNTP
jgi:predicted ribosomally synthesized peptide with SipW-like signal peptide